MDTYREWARQLKILDKRYYVLHPWIYLFAQSNPQYKCWYNLGKDTQGNPGRPFDVIKSHMEDLSHDQHRPTLCALSYDEALFFYKGGEDYTDDFIRRWRPRVDTIRENHRGRGKPNPPLTDEDRRLLLSELLDPMAQLVAEMRTQVGQTHEQHTSKVLAQLADYKNALMRHIKS